MNEEEKSKNAPVVITTPVAIIIAGVIIALSVIVSNMGLLNFGNENGSPSSSGYKFQEYVNIAKEIGIKEKEFKSCMEVFDTSEVDKDLQDGQSAGVNGTPSFFIGRSSEDGMINGVWLKGAYPIDYFQTIIDGLLENDDQRILSKMSEGLPEGSVLPTKIEDLLNQTSVDDDPVLGDQNAPITIVEFSDYECPFCQRAFKQTYPIIKSTYVDSGKAKFVFRDFPIANIHPKAMDMAVAANCARAQGGDSKYYEFHDKLFSLTPRQ